MPALHCRILEPNWYSLWWMPMMTQARQPTSRLKRWWRRRYLSLNKLLLSHPAQFLQVQQSLLAAKCQILDSIHK